MDEAPKPKRKKELTGNEIIGKLKANDNDVSKAVQEVIEELCPFDITDEEALKIEGRVERLQKTNRLLEMKLWKVKQQIKERKFRHKPEVLDEKFVSSSQYSIFDSQEEEIDQGEESGDEEWMEGEEVDGKRPKRYRKKPLDGDMSRFARRRRVSGKLIVVYKQTELTFFALF